MFIASASTFGAALDSGCEPVEFQIGNDVGRWLLSSQENTAPKNNTAKAEMYRALIV